jgi:hypothetical protein
MSDQRHTDLSRIRDEDLTPEQAAELRRRFQAFTRALAMARASAPEVPRAKTIAKWTPKRLRIVRG